MTDGIQQLPEFDRPRETLDWAREGINEIDSEIGAFFDRQELRETNEYNPKRGEYIYKLSAVYPVPKILRRKATEILNNTRHSFDQSLFAACLAINKPLRSVYFPWSRNPTPDLARLLEHRRIPVELWDVIRRQEPYPRGDGYSGGDDLIRELAKIANGKHTVGLEIAGQVANWKFSGVITFGAGQSKLLMPRWDPVNNEIILGISENPIDAHGDTEIALNIAFHEAPPLRGVPVRGGLATFLNKAEQVLSDLEAACVSCLS